MGDKLKTIDFGNFKLDVTEDQFEKIGEEVDIENENGVYMVYEPCIEIGEHIDETLIWYTKGGIWNQSDFFEKGDGTYFEFEFSRPIEKINSLKNFDFNLKSKMDSLFLKDNTSGKFLMPSDYPKFNSFDDFDDFYQVDSSEIYLLKDFDIKNNLDI